MNTIESILNDIDELLEDSWSLPLSGGRCVVDAEKVRDLIDSIRMNMPAEIKQARAVVADRNQILSLAKGEAEALIRKAEERAKQLLEQESIVRQNILRTSQEVVAKSLGNITTTRQALAQAASQAGLREEPLEK